MKSKGHPRKCWLVRVYFLKKELNLHDKILDMKLIKDPLIKCEEFEMALQHKSKLHVCKELKCGVWFEEFLKNVK